jgi:hypothetical protein
VNFTPTRPLETGPDWLGREDSNLRMAESKSAALPLGYAPMHTAGLPPALAFGARKITARPPWINDALPGRPAINTGTGPYNAAAIYRDRYI